LQKFHPKIRKEHPQLDIPKIAHERERDNNPKWAKISEVSVSSESCDYKK
jgi:hypothetical protein